MSRWILLDLAVALTVGFLASSRWGYPWQLAVLTGGAVGAFTYATRRTYFNLRQIHESPPGWGPYDEEDDGVGDEEPADED